MSKRKPCNRKVQIERSMRALLGTNYASVINIDPSGLQVMVHWKNGKQILSKKVADALCDIPHRWTIHIAGICVRQDGAQYIKSIEAKPDGIHLVEKLSDVIEHFYNEVKSDCNPNHLVGMGWLAVPGVVPISEAQLSALFASVGAWNQQKVDSCAA